MIERPTHRDPLTPWIKSSPELVETLFKCAVLQIAIDLWQRYADMLREEAKRASEIHHHRILRQEELRLQMLKFEKLKTIR